MEALLIKSRHKSVLCGLAACNLASLAAALGLVLVLNPEDRISNRRGSMLFGLGLVYYLTLSEALNVLALATAAGKRFRHKYRLTSGEVLDINNKVVSGVQAGWSCATGAVVCAWSCRRGVATASHYMSEAYAWFGAAYFAYDIWSMYMVHVYMVGGGPRKEGASGAHVGRPVSFLQYCRYEPVILLHHIFIGAFGFLVIVYFRGALGDCVFGFAYLMELSTPCVSLRGVLSRLRLKASRGYLANGLLMLATFFLCRIAAMPYACWLYSREVGKPYFQTIASLPPGCKISICLLMLPQVYWFYLMCAGAVKVLRSPAAVSAPPGAGDAAR